MNAPEDVVASSETLQDGQADVALQLYNDKQLKHVGVAVRRPRARASCVKGQADEDMKQWELLVFSFSDSSQLTNLESLLVQLTPSTCFLSADLERTQSTGDSKKLHALLQTHHVARVYMKKQLFTDVRGVETNVARLLGAHRMAEYHDLLASNVVAGSLACLLEALGVMTDTDAFGCYTLRKGNPSCAMQLDSAAVWSLNVLPGRGKIDLD